MTENSQPDHLPLVQFYLLFWGTLLLFFLTYENIKRCYILFAYSAKKITTYIGPFCTHLHNHSLYVSVKYWLNLLN
jgi:hypothetical protein